MTIKHLLRSGLMIGCALALLALAWPQAADAQVRRQDQRLKRDAPFRHDFQRGFSHPIGPVLALPLRLADTGGAISVGDERGMLTIAAAIQEKLAGMDLVNLHAGPALGDNHWPSVSLHDEELMTGQERQGGNRRYALSVTGPSKAWRESMATACAEAEASHFVVLSLGVGELYLRQDRRGRKDLPMGAGHVMRVGWFNDLESQVAVLTLGGALYDREGRLVRAVVEGITAGKPTFWSGVLAKTITGGRGRLTTIGDIDNPAVVLHQVRREDIPDAPLAWEVALHNLLTQLLGRPDGLILP